MAEIPGFIYTILNKELYDIQRRLLERVAIENDLDPENLIEKYLKDPLAIVPNTTTKVEVVKRAAPKQVPSDSERCMARVWNRGKGGQCTRRRNGCEFCMGHQNCGIKHGRIDEPPPTHIFGRTRAVYK